MGLRATLVPVADLTPGQIDRMFSLMRSYFEGMDRRQFETDLLEKQWVVLLSTSASKQTCGFSTLRILEDRVQDVAVRAIFSGDTIIDRAHWGHQALERAWLPFVMSHVEENPQCRWFWFLISKGYRTFRYLPVYFHRYYPNPDHATPALEREITDRLARAKFGRYYDATHGTIHEPADYHLRSGVSDITQRELRDRRVAFFMQKNPDWSNGVELACLAELDRNNLRPTARRLLPGAAKAMAR